jgi:hypothetical protein
MLPGLIGDNVHDVEFAPKHTESRKMAATSEPQKRRSRATSRNEERCPLRDLWRRRRLFIVLAVGLYSAPTKTTGIAIAFGKNGISIQEKANE